MPATTKRAPSVACGYCGADMAHWDDEASLSTWFQHGENPEHRRLFPEPWAHTADLPLRWTLHYSVGEWISEIHPNEKGERYVTLFHETGAP
jgi:hypothetical protein